MSKAIKETKQSTNLNYCPVCNYFSAGQVCQQCNKPIKPTNTN